MTDNEIIKVLECCGKECSCEKCALNTWLDEKRDCIGAILVNALDLINRLQDEKQALINGQETLQNTIVEQKAEIERLKKKANTPFAKVTFDENKLKEIVSDVAKNIEFNLNSVKSEAIKEFAEQVKIAFYYEFDELIPSIMADKIDNLVKEMTEVQK